MSYTLPLTHDERKAIDWVGYRYHTGDDLYKILVSCLPDDAAWEMEGEITFTIPEHKAWEIVDLFEAEEMLFPCFSASFAEKLLAFAEKIV